MIRTLCIAVLVGGGFVALAQAAPTRTSPVAVAPDGTVFVVNPDSSSVARLDFSGVQAVLTHEASVGAYPRTVTLAGSSVYTADQKGDGITRCDQAAPDSATCTFTSLGPGCNPYGITATPAGNALVVSCQGSSELLVLTPSLDVTARIKLPWPQARAIAVSSDGARAYVTHFITEEPGTDAHVSVVDLGNKAVSTVFSIAADSTTCETQNSGQGVLNQLSAIALIPDGAPADVAGQLWVGGEQENNVSKGIFKRASDSFCTKKRVGKGKKRRTVCVPKPGTELFPLVTFTPFPQDGISRNKYQPSFHDIIRLGIVKLNATDGTRVGKIDIDEAAIATDIDFSADGTTAFVVDQTFNSYHVFNTRKGQGNDVTTIFAAPGALGPGGADPAKPCLSEALPHVTSEVPFRIAPQSQIVTIDGYDPIDTSYNVVNTGVDFDARTYYQTSQGGGTPVSQMRAVPDGIGTAPLGVRVAPSGDRAYVFNYLARNVVAVAGPGNDLRCSNNATSTCQTDTDCAGGGGFCNHPGGPACNNDGDCGSDGPCVRTAACIPLILAGPVSTITGRCPDVGGEPACKSNADCATGSCVGIKGDPMPPSILDGKILFTTAARDASVPNGVGLGQAAPRFNEPQVTCASGPNVGQKCLRQKDCGDESKRLCSVGHNTPGEVVSVAHDASYVSCTTCHADFGGQDGRTWDFSQFGASLRNTMDLRGRPGFAPGTCNGGPSDGQSCTFDAACGDGFRCKANQATIPPNVPAADRDRWFNPMLTVHWNGDRDEVEDFEFTFRSLQGSGDCDGVEQLTKTCFGALVSRDPTLTIEVPRPNTLVPPVNDVEPDLGPPNRNLPGVNGNDVGVRLTHVADFVYSLTDFVKNPNQPDAATERGRAIFNDPSTQCGDCHNGGYGGGQFFTDKAPVASLGAGPARGDVNNPFKRHDVGTANIFDQTDPYAVGLADQTLQNTTIPIPASRGALGDYVTPVLVDLWNTAPYLHDGSAPNLLDVIRPCDTTLDTCTRLGAGRSLHDVGVGRHGKTDILTPKQLNDLVAFQKSLTTGTVLGTRNRVIKAGAMTVSRVKLTFGKVKNGTRGPGSFKLAGTFGDVAVDPSAGIALQLGAPSAGTMVVFEQTISLTAHGARFVGKTTVGAGSVSLTLSKAKDGDYRFVLVGKRLDLSALDTGNPDLTTAFVVGDTQFVRNRTLVQKKQTYGLPKKRKG